MSMWRLNKEQVRKIEQVRKRGLPPLLSELVQQRGQAPLPDLFFSNSSRFFFNNRKKS